MEFADPGLDVIHFLQKQGGQGSFFTNGSVDPPRSPSASPPRLDPTRSGPRPRLCRCTKNGVSARSRSQLPFFCVAHFEPDYQEKPLK